MKYFLILTVMFSSLVQAQIFDGRLPHNGGNGGDHLEISLKNTLIHISEFVKSKHGQVLFKNDFEVTVFEEAVLSVDIRVLDEDFKKSCSTHDRAKMLIIVSRNCIETKLQNNDELYVLLMEETLNLIGAPKQVASKLLQVSGFIQRSMTQAVFAKDCSLAVVKSDSNIDLPRMGINILVSKGYTLNNSSSSIVLDMKTFAIDESEKSLVGNHGFSKTNFNGVIRLSISGHSFVEYVPVKVKIQKSKVSVKSGHGPALIESLLKMPSCVKI